MQTTEVGQGSTPSLSSSPWKNQTLTKKVPITFVV